MDSFVSKEYRVAIPTEQTKTGDDVILGIGTTGLTTFGSLATELAAFVVINKNYKIAITAAESGDTDLINARNSMQKDIYVPALDSLAEGVENIALGKKSVVELSGFKSTKDEREKRVIPSKMMLDAASGVSGSNTINMSSKTKMDADGYLTFALETGSGSIAQNGNQFLVSIPDSDGKTIHTVNLLLSTTRDGSMTGLVRKDELDVQQVGVNPAGCSPLSNKANVLVP